MNGSGLRSFARSQLPLCVAAAAALAFKRFYQSASADELGFLLAPSAHLAGAISGFEFVAEAGRGFLCRELALSIAPVCAGGNFLIVCFATLCFGFASRYRRLGSRLTWVAVCAPIAYAATLLANALRITLAIALGRDGARFGLSDAGLHRAEGTFVYLGVLLALYLGAAHFFERARAVEPREPRWGVLLPLGIYLGVTLAVPLLRGAGRDPRFSGAHAPAVLLASGVALAVFALGAWLRASSRRACGAPLPAQLALKKSVSPALRTTSAS